MKRTSAPGTRAEKRSNEHITRWYQTTLNDQLRTWRAVVEQKHQLPHPQNTAINHPKHQLRSCCHVVTPPHLTMKEPVTRYSPVGAVLLTCGTVPQVFTMPEKRGDENIDMSQTYKDASRKEMENTNKRSPSSQITRCISSLKGNGQILTASRKTSQNPLPSLLSSPPTWSA